MSEHAGDRAAYALRRLVNAEQEYDVLHDGRVVGSLQAIKGSRRKPSRWWLTLHGVASPASTQEFASFAAVAAWLGLVS